MCRLCVQGAPRCDLPPVGRLAHAVSASAAKTLFLLFFNCLLPVLSVVPRRNELILHRLNVKGW
ncbi:MAG: hypothetical protein C0511_12655 [Hyphomicrobium sp.]|nr:hypothetical protein [Hyphomicrobium sp.]PPC80867.1 MAG: hypothetical protein CTY40_08280 [Hyphomicrobium sp.]